MKKIFSSIFPSRSKVEPESIQVGVAFPGRREVIEVKPTDTVEELKRKVLQTVGIPVEDQVMEFSNKVLKNNRTLKHYGIETNRTVLLKGEYHQYVKMNPADPTLRRLEDRMKNGSLAIGANNRAVVKPESESVETEEKAKDARDEITATYTIRFANKVVEHVLIGKQKSAKEMEKQIMDLCKLPNMENHIVVRSGAPQSTRTSILNSDATVAELEIDNTLVEVRAVNVTFKLSLPDGTVHTMDYHMDDDISKLVEYLLSLNIDDPETLVLTKEGERVPVEGKFSELGIVTGSYLDLKRVADFGNTIHITIKFGTDQTLELDVDPEEEIWDVMKKVEAAGGGNAQRMSLVDADGNELDDEGNLKDWCVQDGAILQVRDS